MIKSPKSEVEWFRVANRFGNLWNFPQCIGAVDGKHVAIKRPAHSHTIYYNYKGFYSIVLLAMVDANYKFMYIDVGKEGSVGDASTWNNCEIKRRIENNSLNIPSPTQPNLPYVFVGDEAFAIKSYFMKPFPRRNLDLKKKVFNYRLSRARRIVENTFGILVNRFRVLKKPMDVHPETAKLIVTSCCILHNYLRDQNANDYLLNHVDQELTSRGELRRGNWRNHVVPFASLANSPETNSCPLIASTIRNNFAEYFVNEGDVEFQYRMVENNIIL